MLVALKTFIKGETSQEESQGEYSPCDVGWGEGHSTPEPGLVLLAVPPAPQWPLAHLDSPYYLGLDVEKPQPLPPESSQSKTNMFQR